jgi:hypothetical protein
LFGSVDVSTQTPLQSAKGDAQVVMGPESPVDGAVSAPPSELDDPAVWPPHAARSGTEARKTRGVKLRMIRGV